MDRQTGGMLYRGESMKFSLFECFIKINNQTRHFKKEKITQIALVEDRVTWVNQIVR